MILFDSNELEIAIVTYNRPKHIKKWLELCYEDCKSRNIRLSIYDSSNNDETKKIIDDNYKKIIKYFHIDSNISIGYKPMLPILNTTSKYLWVSGDSRYHDFVTLDKTVFKSIKDDIDYILISAGYHNECDNYEFIDKTEFINKCFISSTCIGLSIYKTSIFYQLKINNNLLIECDTKYRNNYGFAWLGYFYECFSTRQYIVKYHVIQTKSVIAENKKQFWTTRFYECWVENLIGIADNLPNCYLSKYIIPKKVWEEMNLDSIYYCCLARIRNGLNKKIFYKYESCNMLKRVTNNIAKIKFFAIMPISIIYIVFLLYKVINRIKHIFNNYILKM